MLKNLTSITENEVKEFAILFSSKLLYVVFFSLFILWLTGWFFNYSWSWLLVSHSFVFTLNVLMHLFWAGGVQVSTEDLINLLDPAALGLQTYIFGADRVTLWFISLVFAVNFIALSSAVYSVHKLRKLFFSLIFSLSFFSMGAFLSVNLFIFYIFFELTLLPVYFLIIIWGSRDRRSHASKLYLYFSLAGSFFLLSAMIMLFQKTGSLSINILVNYNFYPCWDNFIIVTFLLLGFLVKVPIVPFHIWLPEAHVEAPTAGSVVLAGYLLKLGTYGLFRFVIPVFPALVSSLTPLIISVCLLGIIYCSIIMFRQIDLKKFIAYSSVLHMSVTVIGLIIIDVDSKVGAIVFMLSHGIVSAGLFASVGMLYSRYSSRNLYDYGRVATRMPLFSSFFFLLCLANFSLPSTSNYVGELMILVGLTKIDKVSAFVICLSTFFIGIFSIWVFNRVCFGENSWLIKFYLDLTRPEIYTLGFITLCVCTMGVYPPIVVDSIVGVIHYQVNTIVSGCEVCYIAPKPLSFDWSWVFRSKPSQGGEAAQLGGIFELWENGTLKLHKTYLMHRTVIDPSKFDFMSEQPVISIQKSAKVSSVKLWFWLPYIYGLGSLLLFSYTYGFRDTAKAICKVFFEQRKKFLGY